MLGVQSTLNGSSLVRSLCANGYDVDCARCYIPKWILLSIPMCANILMLTMLPMLLMPRWKSETEPSTQHSLSYSYTSIHPLCASIHRECKVVMRKKQRIFLHQCVEQFLFSRISSVLQFWRFSGIWFFTFSTIPSKRSNVIPNICVRKIFVCGYGKRFNIQHHYGSAPHNFNVSVTPLNRREDFATRDANNTRFGVTF